MAQVKLYRGIPLTGVTTRCSIPGYRGLPQEPFGACLSVTEWRPWLSDGWSEAIREL